MGIIVLLLGLQFWFCEFARASMFLSNGTFNRDSNILLNPKNSQYVCNGGKLTLKCLYNDSIFWIINSVEFNPYLITNMSSRYKFLNESIGNSQVKHILILETASTKDGGVYVCAARDGNYRKTFHIEVVDSPILLNSSHENIAIFNSTALAYFHSTCYFSTLVPSTVFWTSDRSVSERFWSNHVNKPDNYSVVVTNTEANITDISAIYRLISNESCQSNASTCTIYPSFVVSCVARDSCSRLSHNITVTDTESVSVNFDFIIAIGEFSIVFNYSLIPHYVIASGVYVSYKQVVDTQWRNNSVDLIRPAHYSIGHLMADTVYVIRLVVVVGLHNLTTIRTIRTLSFKPVYTPRLKLSGSTASSLSISWDVAPNSTVRPYIHSYKVFITADTSITETAIVDGSVRDYVVRHLTPDTEYRLAVQACGHLEVVCGSWSSPVVHRTSAPVTHAQNTEFAVYCYLEPQYYINGYIRIVWPSYLVQEYGRNATYQVSVQGSSEYRNIEGVTQEAWIDPNNYTYGSDVAGTNTTFIQPTNTNYTINITHNSSCLYTSSCVIGPGLPSRDLGLRWWHQNRAGRERAGFTHVEMVVPLISNRHTRVCCYTVIVVPLQDEEMIIYRRVDESYLFSHNEAYVAEQFEPTPGLSMAKHIILGDGKADVSACVLCGSNITHSSVADHPLHITSYYAIYVQLLVIVSSGEPPKLMRVNSSIIMLEYNDFLDKSMDTRRTLMPERSGGGGGGGTGSLLEVILVSVIVLCVCVLLFIVGLCTFRTIGKRATLNKRFRRVVQSVRCLHSHSSAVYQHQQTMDSSSTSGLTCFTRQPTRTLQCLLGEPCVSRDALLEMYLQKCRDSDEGFREEFELLPATFSDRTTFASDALENSKKNRYPDIRSYDQTRVKLSVMNDVQSTSYINANYVWTYKRMRKYICAQGPLDATLDDFWRLIWEQGCRLIVMLTNLEEMGRIKCAKYWPSELNEECVYADITVTLTSQRWYSDYARRELSVSRTDADGSVQTHTITHLHYLVWRDFMAPECCSGILRFIGTVHSVYRAEEMGPLLIHCSAGVGRTGTFVAIDSLLAQLEEESQVSVFRTVYDLRRQRNYMVQSQRQYIFVYRALVESVQFGNTSVSSSQFSAYYQSLLAPTSPISGDINECDNMLQRQFHKLSEVLEERKAFTVAGSEDNMGKNRYPYILPYDDNRVILRPCSTYPNDTYINASIIQGYNSADEYVITQDPLVDTRTDFWRMVLDLEISVILMLSKYSPCENEAESSNQSDSYPYCPPYLPHTVGGEMEFNNGQIVLRCVARYKHGGCCQEQKQKFGDDDELSCDISLPTPDSGDQPSSCASHILACRTSRQLVVTTLHVQNTRLREQLYVQHIHYDMHQTNVSEAVETVCQQIAASDHCPATANQCASDERNLATPSHALEPLTIVEDTTALCDIMRVVQLAATLSHTMCTENAERDGGRYGGHMCGRIEMCSSPTLIHCSGGAYRSSIVVTLSILLQQLAREQSIDVFQTVRRLRNQRQCQMQSQQQYDVIYRAFHLYLSQSESCDTDHAYHLCSQQSMTSQEEDGFGVRR